MGSIFLIYERDFNEKGLLACLQPNQHRSNVHTARLSGMHRP